MLTIFIGDSPWHSVAGPMGAAGRMKKGRRNCGPVGFCCEKQSKPRDRSAAKRNDQAHTQRRVGNAGVFDLGQSSGQGHAVLEFVIRAN